MGQPFKYAAETEHTWTRGEILRHRAPIRRCAPPTTRAAFDRTAPFAHLVELIDACAPIHRTETG